MTNPLHNTRFIEVSISALDADRNEIPGENYSEVLDYTLSETTNVVNSAKDLFNEIIARKEK